MADVKGVLRAIGVAVLGTVSKVVPEFLPLARMLAGATPSKTDDKIVDTLSGIVNVTKLGEVMIGAIKDKGLTNEDKAKATLPVVRQLILTSEVVAGHEITDEDELTAIALGHIELAVRLQKILKKK